MCAGVDGPGKKTSKEEDWKDNYSDGDPYESDKKNWG